MIRATKKVKAEYTFPMEEKFQPRSYQVPLMNALNHQDIKLEDGTIQHIGARMAISILPRRHGKDLTSFHIIVREALKKRGVYHYCLPTYTQAKKVIWDSITSDGIKFLEYVPEGLITAMNQQDLKLELYNGSIIQFIGTDNIDAVRGTNPMGVVFSEYAYMSPAVLDVYSPIMAANGGWMLFVSTPNGRNHFFDLKIRAEEEVRKGNKDWFVQHHSAYELNILTPEILAEEKRRMPAPMFSQEYECKFLDGASQFFKRIHENVYQERLQPVKQHEYQIGIDLGKSNDYTVLTAIDMTNFTVLQQDVFNKIDYTMQKAMIEAYWFRHNEGIAYIDKTGVGDSVCDDLIRVIPNLQPCFFTEKFRNDILNNLRILIEQDRIKLPNDPELLAQLESFRYIITPTGKTKIGVPDSQHDDRVMSLALAVQNMPDWTLPIYRKEKRTYNHFSYLD